MVSIGRIPWRPHSPKRQRGDGWASKPVPALRSCEKLASGRPGRQNRLPHRPSGPKVCKLGGAGGFACRANSSHLLTLRGYVEIVAARSEESLEVDLRSQLDLSRRAGDAVADPSKDRRSQNRRAGTKLLSMPERQLHYPVGLNHVRPVEIRYAVVQLAIVDIERRGSRRLRVACADGG